MTNEGPSRNSRTVAPDFWAAMLLAGLLVAAWAVMTPGLAGGFLLDDMLNLQALSDLARNPSWQGAIRYAFDGVGGTRPLSYLSFAAQYADWPRNPEGLRRVTLALHLVNGCLVLLVLLRTGSIAGLTRSAALVPALFATAAFLLHPMQASTVLYLVQRMTVLASLFVLLALLCYLRGREQVAAGRTRAAFPWLAIGFPLCASLAVVSKETGVLIVAYVAVLELTVLRRQPVPRAWDRVLVLGAALLLALVAAYAASQVGNWEAAYRLRDFGPWERVLTQPGILLDYLGKLLFPRPRAFGLYFDDYPAARGLLTPPATLAAALAIVAMAAAGLALRRRAPIAAMGILWFLAGHFLEASPLPLELYFEHRNYLPLVGPLYAVAHYVARVGDRVSGWIAPVAGGTMAAALILFYASLTFQEARLWGNPFKQAVVWSEERPASKRAQIVMANWFATRSPVRAVEVLRRADAADPADARFLLMWYVLACDDPGVTPPAIEELVARLRVSTYSHTVMAGLEELAQQREDRRCRRLPYGDLVRVMEAVLANDRFGVPAARGPVHFHLGRIHAAEGHLNEAMESLDRAFALIPKPEISSHQVSWLVSAGLYDDALRYVDVAWRASEAQGLRHRLRAQELIHWRESVQARQLAAAGRPAAPAPEKR